MAQFCSQCRRGNPDQAVFCYFDGIPLRQGAVAATVAAAPGAELVFPSGRRCRTFDDLVQGCQSEWEEARQLLQSGALTGFLKRMGRADIVHAVQETNGKEDADIALYNFLNLLPASPAQGPKLDLQPRRISFKKVTVGEHAEVELTLVNLGRGVLQGKVMVSEGQEWLRLPGDETGQARIKTQRDQHITLSVDTRVLVGGLEYTGRLTVITNGGIAEVPVRLYLASVPFGHAPYKGAAKPRELAQRMLTNPKPAVHLLETGEVSRWFAANGWNYPVAGEPARGVAAVQQFFECLGLSKPPTLQLSDSEVRLQCKAPQVVSGQVTVRANSRKWVFAQTECDAPWLRVTTPSVSGPQQTQIRFEVDTEDLPAGQVHQAALVIRANGNQKFSVRVQVEVKERAISAAARWLRPVLVGACLGFVYRLLLVFPADIWARHGFGTLAFWQHAPRAEDGFLRSFVLATWWVGGLAGAAAIWKKGGQWADRVCGLVAGSAAGLALAGLLACLLVLLDALPRGLAAMLAGLLGPHLSPVISGLLWFAAAVLSWAMLGAGLGLGLSVLGNPGMRALAIVGSPLAGLCRLCRLDSLARWLPGR